MADESLEKMLNSVPSMEFESKFYNTLDIYTNGLSHMYNFGHPGDKPPSFGPNNPLTIRDFPSSGVQLHIHDGPGGTAHFKTYDRKDTIPINSYDAAMADFTLPEEFIQKIIKGYK
jgi:hypothetical protein